jgi:hypothetical protein
VAIPSDSVFISSLPCGARFLGRAAGAVLAGRRFDSTKRFSRDVLAKNSSYFPIGLILDLCNRLEVVKDLWNELHLLNYSPFYRIHSF